jgi:hypothetical protein
MYLLHVRSTVPDSDMLDALKQICMEMTTNCRKAKMNIIKHAKEKVVGVQRNKYTKMFAQNKKSEVLIHFGFSPKSRDLQIQHIGYKICFSISTTFVRNFFFASIII